jgi:hypothetical protein
MPVQRGLPPRLHKLCNSIHAVEGECFCSYSWPLLQYHPFLPLSEVGLLVLQVEAPSLPALDVEVNSDATEYESLEEAEMVYHM